MPLEHLHQTSYTVPAFLPGNPGSSAVGEFTVHLHPPGSPGYAANKATYDALDYGQRIEMYEGYTAEGIGLGKLVFAGIITGIDRKYGENSHFTLTGVSDLGLANLSRPFPGEVLSLQYTNLTGPASYRQARAYFGTNEPGASDNFNPYTSANYTSTGLPSLTAGTWTGTTDDGLNVVSCSTGSGAALISKTGAAAQDKRHSFLMEISGRLLVTGTSATNAGKFGVGLSASNVNCNNCSLAYVTAKWNAGTQRYDLDVTAQTYAAGVINATTTVSNALTSVDDPEGYIPITISMLLSLDQGATSALNGNVTVNGTVIYGVNGPAGFSADFGAGFMSYPFAFYGTPASGAATAYAANLIQVTRYTDDQNPNTATFKSGSIGTPAHSLTPWVDASPTFLEMWSRVATREGWYWRYTPAPYVLGSRVLGTIDLTTDPGTDLGTTKKVVFSREAGNLVSLQLSANTDAFASGMIAASSAGTDGGGNVPWRDVPSMSRYGVIDDQSLAITAPNFPEQRRTAYQIVANKTALGTAGSKTATVLRDPDTADKWRELDKVMIHDPEQGILNLVARVISYTFDEGLATQTLTLDQFGEDSVVAAKRFQQGLFQVASKFKTR